MSGLHVADLRKSALRTLVVATMLVVAVFWINRALSRRTVAPPEVVTPALTVVEDPKSPVLRLDLQRSLANRDPRLPVLSGRLRVRSLVLVRTGDLGAIARLHPTAVDSLTVTSALPPLPAGEYHAFADVETAGGVSGLLVESVRLPGGMRRWHPSNLADAMFTGGGVGTPFRFEDGTTLAWLGAGEKRHVGDDAGLHFVLRDAAGRPQLSGRPADGEAHAVLVRSDGGSYTQLDSMTYDAKTGDLHFPYVIPAIGRYRLWVQLPVRGRVRTAAFEVTVAERAK